MQRNPPLWHIHIGGDDIDQARRHLRVTVRVADEKSNPAGPPRYRGFYVLGSDIDVAMARVQAIQIGQRPRRLDAVDQDWDQRLAVDIGLAKSGAAHLRILKVRGPGVPGDEDEENVAGAQVLDLM